jgi:hypothetical protein
MTAPKKQDSRKRSPAGRYTPDEIELGLGALAFCAGNSRKASRLLEGQDINFAHSTLHDWARKNPELYADAQERMQDKIAARQAERFTAFVDDFLDVEEKLLERVREGAADMKPGEAATAIKNLHIASGISQDKAADLLGRPRRPEADHEDTAKLLETFVTRFGGVMTEEARRRFGILQGNSVDSTARELPEESS